MSYNTDHLRTAGKITVYTAFIGVVVFAFAFIFNLGVKEIQHVDAQSNATTSVTVLNTPPQWTVDAEELDGSSIATPTNVGSAVTWTAIATDGNAEPYYLLICSTNASATANSGAAPACNGGTQWAVSTSTLSGQRAYVSTTTLAAWSEANIWYAFVCDANAVTPRCNGYAQQGSGTTSSPFVVNHRPAFTAFADDSPATPGQTVTFYSSSTDPDSLGGADTVRLFVCATAGFDTTNDRCTGTELASSTVDFASNATATYTIVIPTQDQNYGAYGYVIDNHGFEVSGGANGTDAVLTVSNVAPTVATSTISLNGGTNMTLSVEAGETTGFTLQFTADDDNSCVNAASGDEVTDYALSVYRSGTGVSSTTCTVGAGSYNANRCYPSGVPTTTWNISCTASSTSCTGNDDTDVVWDCTFPLWYIADPTDGTATSTEYSTDDWRAQVQAIDDDAATGALAEGGLAVEVTSFLAFALNTLSIPYGALEPGNFTDPLVATTTIAATGNVGLDKDVTGESMCTTYTGSTLCPNSASSTINAEEQRFATDTVAFALSTALSSTTAQEIEINVPKSTSTTTQATANAFWGINVPASITYAGDYYGENTFTAIVGESADW